MGLPVIYSVSSVLDLVKPRFEVLKALPEPADRIALPETLSGTILSHEIFLGSL